MQTFQEDYEMRNAGSSNPRLKKNIDHDRPVCSSLNILMSETRTGQSMAIRNVLFASMSILTSESFRINLLKIQRARQIVFEFF